MEVIIALAIFSLIAAAMATMVLGGSAALIQGGEQTEAEAFAQEGIEAVRAIRDRAWNELIYSRSGIAASSGQWIFKGASSTDSWGKYTRVIDFFDVCRDISDEIVNCPSGQKDLQTKKVAVNVTWDIRTNVKNEVKQIAYLTNWRSLDWTEDLSNDFNDGTFTNTEISTLGDGDGAIVLKKINPTSTVFMASGTYMSSVFNLGDKKPVQILTWQRSFSDSNCGLNCQLKLQLRVAPDNNGQPGTWTEWYGVNGTSTYFISPTSTLLSTDLNWRQWIQYQALFNGDGSSTPVLEDIKINYR